MDPALVPAEVFEAMVVDALDTLPAWVVPIVAEIAVLVEDEQDAADAQDGILCLGRYRASHAPAITGALPGLCPTRSPSTGSRSWPSALEQRTSPTAS
jgi:predicted Zn-dependent protease with MMP-like domain